MAVKAATTCLQFSQPIASHSASASQAIAATPLTRCSRSEGSLPSLLVQRADRATLFGSEPHPLTRSNSCEQFKSKTWKSACRARLDEFSAPDFYNDIQDLALKFRSSNNGEESHSLKAARGHNSVMKAPIKKQKWLSLSEIHQESMDWRRDEIVPANIEWKANKVEIPVSLRLIKRKLKSEEGLTSASQSACTPINKALSSSVFIIRELQSYALQMREVLFYENLEEISVGVQQEMNASFVWIFQQVFSQTPTLMIYVMILLANYLVHSMGSAGEVASSPPAVSCAAVAEGEVQDSEHRSFDACSAYSSASGADGDDGWFNSSDQVRPVAADGASQLSSLRSTKEEGSISGQAVIESELRLWNSMVEEACCLRGDSLDDETKRRFVLPVSTDDYPAEHLRTEVFYQMSLSEDPNNCLILTNYAQFLYLIAQDCDRAEEYFKEAIAAEPVDAEARSKYAMFLWRGRNDLWAAEENFLEAISAEPENSYYAAGYANFLWNTGGEETCFPLDAAEQRDS